MGNKILTESAGNGLDNLSIKMMNADQFFCKQTYSKFAKNLVYDIEQNKEKIKNMFESFDKENQKYSDNQKGDDPLEDLEINEILMTGFYKPDMSLHEIKNPRFEKSYQSPPIEKINENLLLSRKYGKLYKLYWFMRELSKIDTNVKEDFIKDLKGIRNRSEDPKKKNLS